MGCGRTGSLLAVEFESRGHSVAIIDRVSDAFRRLPPDFQGQKITGMGFDRETLLSAGVEDAYGFAAVSDGDNSNILAARVVRETYGVENVVARIADPGRAEVYQRLGIVTVAPVPWTSAQIVGRLLPSATEEVFADVSADIMLKRHLLNDGWIGRTYMELEDAIKARVAYVVRFTEGILPDADMLIQEGDEPFLAHSRDDDADIERVLAKPPTSAASKRKKRGKR